MDRRPRSASMASVQATAIIGEQTSKIAMLTKQVKSLKGDNSDLKKEVDSLQVQNNSLEIEIAKLRKENAKNAESLAKINNLKIKLKDTDRLRDKYYQEGKACKYYFKENEVRSKNCQFHPASPPKSPAEKKFSKFKNQLFKD